jgi:hypothetical protein
MAFAAALLASCSAGVSAAEMERLQAEMQAAFQHKGQKVTSFKLTSDSSTQVSGMIYVEVPTPAGNRTFYTTCLAKIEPASRHFNWHCDSVP